MRSLLEEPNPHGPRLKSCNTTTSCIKAAKDTTYSVQHKSKSSEAEPWVGQQLTFSVNKDFRWSDGEVTFVMMTFYVSHFLIICHFLEYRTRDRYF